MEMISHRILKSQLNSIALNGITTIRKDTKAISVQQFLTLWRSFKLSFTSIFLSLALSICVWKNDLGIYVCVFFVIAD